MDQRNIFIVTYRATLGEINQVMVNTSLVMSTLPDINEVLTFLRDDLDLSVAAILDWKLAGSVYYHEDDLPTILPVPEDYDSSMSGAYMVTFKSGNPSMTKTLYDLPVHDDVDLFYYILKQLEEEGYDTPIILNCLHITDYFDYNPAGIEAVDVLKANDTI